MDGRILLSDLCRDLIIFSSPLRPETAGGRPPPIQRLTELFSMR
jgi:hypothetical protein